jgi:hypothetical protein
MMMISILESHGNLDQAIAVEVPPVRPFLGAAYGGTSQAVPALPLAGLE